MCEGADELCTYFPVGYVPELHYEMYDVAVQIKPSEQLAKLENTSVNFHIAWVNPEYTSFQLGFRIFFTIASLIIFCLYCSKILFRIPPQMQKQLTYEQRCALSLSFMLFLFNDPIYPIHILSPSFLTFAMTEFTQSLFIATLLVYWLREVSIYRIERQPQRSHCFVKVIYRTMGSHNCALVFLIFVFLVLFVDIFVLNIFYYVFVGGDPSLAGRFDINNQSTVMDEFMAPAIVTVIIFIAYYAIYMISFSLSIVNICSGDKDMKARRVLFCTGQVIHFFFILFVLFGVFSRHFDNGGFQLVAYTIVNLYVWMLVVLNWPVRVYFKEYDLEGENPKEEKKEDFADIRTVGEQRDYEQDPAAGVGIELKDVKMRPFEPEEELKTDRRGADARDSLLLDD